MRYVLICRDRPDGEPRRLATRDAHLAWVRTQTDRIHLAGPLLHDDGERMVGSLFIIEAESAVEVQAFNDADPYTAAGLWQSVTIHPFRQVLPAA